MVDEERVQGESGGVEYSRRDILRPMEERHSHHVDPKTGERVVGYGDETAHREHESQGVDDEDDLDNLDVYDEDHDEVGEALGQRYGPPVYLFYHHHEERDDGDEVGDDSHFAVPGRHDVNDSARG